MAAGSTRRLIKSYLKFLLGQIPIIENRVMIGSAQPGMSFPNITILVEQDGKYSGGGYMSDIDDTDPRILKLTIEARTLLVDGTEFDLDILCVEIEKTIANQIVLENFVSELLLEYTEYEIEESDNAYGKATLIYTGYID